MQVRAATCIKKDVREVGGGSGGACGARAAEEFKLAAEVLHGARVAEGCECFAVVLN